VPSAEDLLLVRLAIANRMVTQEQVDECMDEADASGASIGRLLVDKGYLKGDSVRLLEKIGGRPMAKTGKRPPRPDSTATMPPQPAGALDGEEDDGDAPEPPSLEDDFVRVLRAKGMVPKDLMREAQAKAKGKPGSERPAIAEALIEEAFLTTFQADDVLKALEQTEYRCEGCGEPAPPPPAEGSGSGRRCAKCELSLPMPGSKIDPDNVGGTPAPVLGRLAIISGVNRGFIYVLRKGAKLTIGRRSTNKVRLFDPGASRDHCIIGEVEGQIALNDRGSRAGTFVQGERVKAHVLRGGDLIRIGATVLEFRAVHSTSKVLTPKITAPAMAPEEIEDLLFGRIAVKLAVVSKKDLEVALAAQDAGETRQVGKILLDRGAMDENSLLKVLKVQRKNLGARSAYADTARENQLFGRIALREGWITERQLNDALRVQGRAEETTHLHQRIGEVMVRKKLLEQAQVQKILRMQGRSGGGPQLPGYEIEEKLGEGGMGAVFRGKQVSLDRTVAVKLLAPKLVAERGYVQRFMREARAAGALNHQNIVRAIDVGHAGKIYYFVMEFIDGETTNDLLKREGPLPEKRAIAVALDVARALDHAAQASMVHRDVKPDNIMIGRDGTVKLCDLGLARGVGPDASVTQSSAGEIVGTPNYVSPEQAKGLDSVDSRSDLYSLGATLYHLVTGELPFRGEGAPVVVMARHITDQLDDPRDFCRISPDFHLILAHLMVKDRRRRYQSPAQLIEDLEALQQGKKPKHAHKSRGRSTIRRV
jgi:serine/threonine-protein kinase